MTKGQRAMAVAKFCPEGHQGKRGTTLENDEVSGSYIRKARTIVQHTPDLADNVLNGTKPLDEAYKDARERMDAASSKESHLVEIRARYTELADKAPLDQGEPRRVGGSARAWERVDLDRGGAS